MYLKTLTLRGFKSFASATRLELEPGITCVVGPNGSGKSNVVDALAWVMGEQGVKNLRGGKMDDVIFAGTSSRQALGRAQVTLTIDNTDGAIPIDYTEVTISRTMFRTGGSEYAVNGEPARLLDIQELLNDSGLGKEMHVIVGQGRLDQILHADPLERRGFIEEAAGVLKHRRRKDKALRKLNGLQANLDRVSDLRAELAGQLGPLGRQAKAARRAARVQAVLRDTGARLLADDVVRVQAQLEAGAETQARASHLQEAKEQLAELDRKIAGTQDELHTQETLADSLAATLRALGGNVGRARALVQRAHDRVGYLHDAPEPAVRADPPEAIEARAKRYDEELAQAKETKAQREQQVQDLTASRDEAQAVLTDLDEALRAERAAAADRVRTRARLENDREQSAKTVASLQAELQDNARQADDLQKEHADATAELDRARTAAKESEGGEATLDGAYEDATAVLDTAQTALAELDERRGGARADLDRARARAEALDLGARLPTATADLLDLHVPGVDTALGELLDIAPGGEQAVSAALATGSAVVAGSLNAALELLNRLDENAAADIIVEPAQSTDGQAEGQSEDTDTPNVHTATDTDWPDLPGPDTQPLAVRSLVRSRRPGLDPVLDRLLSGILVCVDLPAARDLLAGARPADGTPAYVTLDGESVTASRVTRAAGGEAARLAARAALEETTAEADRLEAMVAELDAARPDVQQRVDAAVAAQDTALADLHDSDARIMAAGQEVSQAAGRLARVEEKQADQATRAERLDTRLQEARAAQETATAALADSAQTPGEATEPDTAQRDAQAQEIAQLGEQLMEARIALRAVSDRTTFLSDRIDALRRQAEEARAALLAAEQEAERRREKADAAQQIATRAGQVLEMLQRLESAAEQALTGVRDHRKELAGRVDGLRSAHREAGDTVTELTREETEARLVQERHQSALDDLERRADEQIGLTLEHLVEQFGPHVPVPVVDDDREAADDDAAGDGAAGDGAETTEPRTVAFDRTAVQKAYKRAERDLKNIGTVNPLALEEYEALKERHDFLERQLADIEDSRRDLLGLVREVDNHVQEVFADAYADTAEEFARIFARLFPGGEGALTLTEPNDMLTTGVEVHARPAGKKVKRLSLLSGGERSLVAVALLVAIFKARPSPFYVMDEVEAALDDVNLQRLLTVFQELQEASQLIVITHQKRTMEIADALYGVTMGTDGESTVISQRLVHRTEHESGEGEFADERENGTADEIPTTAEQ